MDGEAFLKMDPYMAFSIINMKLRDEFSDLQDFCSYYNLEKEEVLSKFNNIGYYYEVSSNQFAPNV